ncbi:MAG TPA: ArnT family glycosyltransferase [Candidatus Tripitaka sp. YC43]
MCLNSTSLITIASGLHETHTFITQAFFWRPLANYVSRILYAGFGINPVPYHILALIMHSLNALLVYHIATKLSKDGIVALMAGLMFAAFYRHAGLLFGSGLFYEYGYAFLCLVAIVTFLHFQDTRRSGYLVVSLSSLFVALLLKESAIIAFPLIVVLDQFYRPHPLPRIRWKLILCLAGIGVVYLALRMHFVSSSAGGTPVRVINAIKDVGIYKVLFKQMYKGLYITIANVCPGKDMSGIFYLGFILFIWKATRYRRLAVTAGALVIISILPLLSGAGCTNRYLYFSTAFSVIFLAVVIRYSAVALTDRILSPYAGVGTGLVTGTVLLLIVSLNIHKIHNLEVMYREASCLHKSNIEDVVTAFPNGTKGFRLFLINTPVNLPRSHGGIQIWEGGGNVKYILSLFYKEPDSLGEVIQLTTDLGYPVSTAQGKISIRTSNKELDNISQDPTSKVLVFNPYTKHLEDKTGKTSQEIRMAIENTRN